MWLIQHVLGHCSTGIESDDAFVNGAFPFQVEVQLSFRQKVVQKLAKFILIWMVAWSVVLIIKMEKRQD